jgi:predicted nucleic acid-binding protein
LRPVILDTSIYIGLWGQGRHSDSLALVLRRFLIRHSSVVLSELRRGARTTPPDASSPPTPKIGTSTDAEAFRMTP